MLSISGYLRSSIGKKQLVGLTGLGLSGFVLMHMAGNLLLLVGPEAYNRYSHALVTNPLIELAEAGLVAMFGVHLVMAILLTLQNRAAKPIGIQACASGPKRTGLIVKTLILSGLLVATFLVLHLITFKYGPEYTATYNGVEMRDIYRLVFEKFKEPTFVAWYLLCLVVLGFHLSHGVAATLQTLGFASAKSCKVRFAGQSFAWLVTAGFIAQPIYLYFH